MNALVHQPNMIKQLLATGRVDSCSVSYFENKGGEYITI